jgi:hypothetical protein
MVPIGKTPEWGFEVVDPSTLATASPSALARGRPERSESRDDDFLGENVRVGEIVGVVEVFVCEPEDIEAGFVVIELLFVLFTPNPRSPPFSNDNLATFLLLL